MGMVIAVFVCEIKTVIWATGFRPEYGWLDVPVADEKGRLRHEGGVTQSPGLSAEVTVTLSN